jgi:hypothetical protein
MWVSLWNWYLASSACPWGSVAEQTSQIAGKSRQALTRRFQSIPEVYMFELASKSVSRGASDKLLTHLGALSRAMMHPTRTDQTKGRIIKRKIANGYSFTYVMDPGRNSVCLSSVPVRLLRELGMLLERVSRGENARKLFRQNERRKPKKRDDHQARALAYWSTRALRPDASDRRALRSANAVIPRSSDLSDSTIRKIAQKYRDSSLGFLAFGDKLKDPKVVGGGTIRLRSPQQISALREYLRKKSRRVDE